MVFLCKGDVSMTVRELLKELKQVPKNATIISDDGTGWTSKNVWVEYDEEENTFAVFAGSEGEE